MIISSRTPEGESNRCPICHHVVRMEPSITTRDAPCPHCGHLLWFEADPIDRSAKAGGITLTEAVLRIGSARLGPPSDAERVAVIEALEKLGARENVKMSSTEEWETALRYLGKIAAVDVHEKALTAPSWRELIRSLSSTQ